MAAFAHVNQAVGAICGTVSASFGPFGNDQLLLSSTNKVVITNSGHTVLDALVVAHPVAR
jgi:chaperonin GroEL (HSP60 family)